MLLLKQTLESQEPDVHLKLDGRSLEVLELKELVFGKPRLTSCEIGFEFTVEIKMPPEIVPKYFPSLEVSDTSFLQSSINIIFRYKDGRAQVRCFDIRSSMNDIIGPRFTATLRGERYQVTQEGIDIPESFQGRDVIGVAFSRFLPGFLLYESGEQQERPLFSGLDRVFWNPITDLERELEQHLSYLGPLREEPRRAYLQSGSPSREIGQRGENAAQILWLEKDEKVHYRPDLGQDSVEISLMEAVKSEFQRLGINQPIDVSSAKSIVYQLILESRMRRELEKK
ncbi:MAG: hypothetical protein M5R40_21905 [Anaerolineae bacterium]|nr:hypothetical protein [Anaerolineae bacterium]